METAKTVFSRDEAWKKAVEIRDYLLAGVQAKPTKVAVYLRMGESSVNVKAYYRSAELSDVVENQLSGLEYFSESGKDALKGFPFLVYSVPYKPEELPNPERRSKYFPFG